MKRRDFLKLKFEDNLTSKINLSLDEFKGNWNFTSASHLLKRTLFGTRSSDVTSAVQRGLKKVVSDILKKESDPAPPIYPYKDESGIGYCETWHDKKPNSGFDRKMINALLFWWFGNIFNQPATITEKMILFWHNHFVTESFIVGNAFYFYSYYLLLREQALGNFKTLTEKMTVNTAMLVYLNGNTNFAGKPNENYARELLELFTVGKGPLIAEGNYTNYTENDVLAAAKVLTGWTTDRNTNSAIFKLNLHEKSDKFFSAAFQNKTIKSNGENEYKDLINLIFLQRETALHICRELYTWFVFYKITPEIESNIIEPLADIYYKLGNFKKAFEYSKLYSLEKDTATNIEITNTINDLNRK